jgi:hypothetical protein
MQHRAGACRYNPLLSQLPRAVHSMRRDRPTARVAGVADGIARGAGHTIANALHPSILDSCSDGERGAAR